MKKKLAYAFAALLLSLTSCGGKKEEISSTPGRIDPATITPVEDAQAHKVEGTIHEIHVDESQGKPFVQNGSSDYSIYCINNSLARKAADYIALQVSNCTGADLQIAAYENQTQKGIYIGSRSSFPNVTFPSHSHALGIMGYEIYTVGDSVYLLGTGDESYQLATIRFLDKVLGFDLLYGERIIFSKDGSILPKMSIVEVPDFEYRKIDDLNTTWRYGSGFTDNNLFMGVNGVPFHNDFQYLPPETYGKEHPDWYSSATLSTGASSVSKGSTLGQLCYTAHGNQNELALMQEKVAEKMIQTIDANPSLSNITFTIEDNRSECDCDSCKEMKQKYGGSVAASALLFTNKVDDIVQKHYEDLAKAKNTTKREVYISFFAYSNYETAPAREINGKWEAIDNIKTNDHVCVYLAPIDAKYTHSFYEEENDDARRKVQAWSMITNRLYIWAYETNFLNYLYFFNSFRATAETLRFLKENGTEMVYLENAHNATCRTGFSQLKLYLDAKLTVDCNYNVEKAIDDFFASYYGPAGDIMRNFFEEAASYSEYQEILYPETCNGSIYNLVNDTQVWKKSILEKWEEDCNKALEVIEPLRKEDSVQFNYSRDAILTESIFPRYALLELYGNNYSADTLLAKQKAFKDDADYLGINRASESIDLNSIYQNWGLL